MAWIEAHDTVWENHKTHELAEALGLPLVCAVGHLLSLWHFTLRNAWRDGDLERWGEKGVERAAMWEGKPGIMLKALREAGFMDGWKIQSWLRYSALSRERLRWERGKDRVNALRKRCEGVAKALPERSRGVAQRQNYAIHKRTLNKRTVQKTLKSKTHTPGALPPGIASHGSDNGKERPWADNTNTKGSRRGKELIPEWGRMIGHIRTSWEKKKGNPCPFVDEDFRRLRPRAKIYGACGIMALWDVYLREESEWNRKIGWDMATFLRSISHLLDDIGWEAAREAYIKAGAVPGSLANPPAKADRTFRPNPREVVSPFTSASKLVDSVLTKLGVA